MNHARSKVMLVVCDGLGDRPIPELGHRTPLEAARTPNLDALACEGQTGSMFTVGRVTPGSDVAHLSLFGYDPKVHYSGRGPIEATGLGIRLEPGDVALRANLATVNDDLTIADRRAGRIRDVRDLVQSLQGYSDGDADKCSYGPERRTVRSLLFGGRGCQVVFRTTIRMPRRCQQPS